MLVRSTMSSKEDFTSQVCNAFKKAVESAKEFTLEGREREFRHVLARFLFDELLGWEGHSKIGEIYDITCFDDENFPIIVIETKWGVKPTREIKDKLRKRIEELGSVKYGALASERDFIAYEYTDYKLREITKVNVAETIGVAKGQYGLSEMAKRRILKIESLKRERLIWVEETDYFEKTHREISVAKREGVELLTENLKDVIGDLTAVLVNFFHSYRKRKDHYSGNFLESTFNDWLKLSMKDEDFKKGNENRRSEIAKIFCRETAYVLLGKILFTRICEDKGITKLTISGEGLAESLRYYEERRKNPYLMIFDESREEIRKYYTHLYKLGYFDWWWVSPEKIGVLSLEEKRNQNSLEEDLNASIKKMFRRFNRFDFAQVDRDILGDVYQGYLPPEERKQLGEFYTPTEVIEYILDSAGYTSDNEIRGKKILDPACGSGSFLVEATKRLMGRYKGIGFNSEDPDEAKQIIDECANSIYGLDIHPFACFIAEMNLLFQLVDLYDVVRQKYKSYKLPRIKVYRTDSLAPSGETVELTEFFDNSRLKMLIEETKGADRIKSVKFNYVVGNPPYVRKERISTEYKEKVLAKAHPDVYHGDNDLYVYFIAKGINQLEEDGKLGYIVSGKFLKTRYGAKLRDFILNHCSIKQLLDFGLVDVFKDVANLPIILVFGRKKEDKERIANKLRTVIAKKEKGHAKDLMKHVKANIERKTYSDEFIDVFDIEQSLLGRDVWKLVSPHIYVMLKKIKQNSDFSLKEICDTYYCIKTGLNRVGKQGVLVVTEEEAHNLNIERKLLKPVLRGEDVRRFKINYTNHYLVFPYTKKEKNGEVQYAVVNITEYPYLHQHLCRFKDRLAKRSDIIGTKSKWFELRPCNYYHAFESEKIITPDISKRNNFAYDEGKYFCLDACFMIGIKKDQEKGLEKSRQSLMYLLGILNSKVVEFYFKQISTFVLARHYRYKIEYLEPLPIVGIKDTNKTLAEDITRIVNHILQLNDKSNALSQKTKDFPHSYVEENWELNRMSSVIKRQTLSKKLYTITEKSLRTDYKQRDLDGNETFRIILGKGDFVDFSSEEEASYALEALKNTNKATKRELLEIRFPKYPHLELILSQFRKDREEIVENGKTVKKLERQLDEIVYKLYDITYKERRIIEEYLAKF